MTEQSPPSESASPDAAPIAAHTPEPSPATPARESESSALIGWRDVPGEWPRLVLGLVFAAAVAVVAWILAAASPVTIAAAPLGMILGLGVAALPFPLESAR